MTVHPDYYDVAGGPLTVGELIVKLQELDPTLPVLLSDDDELNDTHQSFDPEVRWVDVDGEIVDDDVVDDSVVARFRKVVVL